MSDVKNIQYRNAKPWHLAAWPLCMGVNNLFVMVMVFVSYAAVGGYGIAVAVAGMIITGTRLFDAVTDPIVAIISDKIDTRFGKIRILLALGYGIMCLSVATIFFFGVGTNVVVFTVAYIFYIVGYTIYGVAQQIGVAVITSNPAQRPKVAGYKSMYTMLASTGVSIYMSMVLAPKYGGLKIGALQDLSLNSIILGTVLVIISMIAITPYDKMENFASSSKTPVKIRDCWELLKGNKSLWAFIIAASSDKVALMSASRPAISMMVFGIVIGNYAFYGKLSLITLIPCLLIIRFVVRLAVKKDTKTAMVQWTLIAIIMALIMIFFMAIGDPTQISVSPIYMGIFFVIYSLYTGARAATSACNQAMIPDIVDYELYRSGKYLPATVAAVYTFVDKIVSSFATTIVAFCVAAIGYTTVMPQPGDPATSSIFWMAMFVWMGFPIIGWLCTLFAMKFYPLDAEYMRKIQLENQQVRCE